MEKNRLIEILEKFKKIKIAVVGDIMLDDYIIGDVERISPEAPVPIVKVKEERFVLGGAANVISNLASLGAQTISFESNVILKLSLTISYFSFLLSNHFKNKNISSIFPNIS